MKAGRYDEARAEGVFAALGLDAQLLRSVLYHHRDNQYHLRLLYLPLSGPPTPSTKSVAAASRMKA